MKKSQKNIQSLRDPSHRMNFNVITCTSNQNGYQPSQLQLQSPQSKGWQSQRFCTYPQLIIIQLIDLGIIEKLTFLSHQSKITTKIDIQSKQSKTDQWKKLGYTSMESNMTTNYQARQLRTVKLNKEIAKFFRFTLHPNYINTVNVFNQVALIAISVYGQRYHPKPLDQMKQRGILPPGAILDKETLDKLRQLQYIKRQAIDNNDFDKASQVKQQIQKLKSGVQALAILQKQKKDAIRREDFQQAKKIFQKMKKIRGPLPRTVVSSNDRYDQYNKQKNYQRDNQTYTPVVQSLNKQNKSISFDINPKKSLKNDPPSPILGLKNGKKLPQINKSQIINFDEIKVGPKSTKNIFQDQQYLYQQQMKYSSQPQTQRKIPKVKMQKQVQQKTGRNRLQYEKTIQNNSIIQPQQNNEIPQQCQQYFTVIPQIIFKNIFSGDKNLRQHAIDQVIDLIQKIQQQDYLQKLFINGVIFIVKNTIDDKIVSILQKSIQLLGSMFKQYKPKSQQIQRENVRYIKDILLKLSQYLGHANDKLKSQAQDVYIILPKFSKLTSKQLCIQTITLNEKMDRSPRVIISKLQMLGQLIRKYDQQKLKSNQSIISEKKQKYQDVIQYAKRFLQDRNSQVRSTAMRLVVFVGKIIGLKELLGSLQDVKENTLKMIQDKLSDNYQQGSKSMMKQRSQSPKNHSPKIQNSRIMSPKKSLNVIKKVEDNNKKQSPKIQTNKKGIPQNKFNEKQPKIISSQTKIKPKQPQPLKYEPKNPQYICEYCQKYDKRLQNENFRDVHWFKSCPMITICKQCKQAVEVQFLNQHLLQQCERKKYYKKCPRCKQAILAKQYNQHVQKKVCIAAKPINIANRCPHCHQDIQPKKKGWLKHLVQQRCPCQNDRVIQSSV